MLAVLYRNRENIVTLQSQYDYLFNDIRDSEYVRHQLSIILRYQMNRWHRLDYFAIVESK